MKEENQSGAGNVYYSCLNSLSLLISILGVQYHNSFL